MVYRTLGLAAAICGLVTAQPAPAADVGRYQILQGPPMILLDTTSGRSWRYDPTGQWMPVPVVEPPPPDTPKETAQQRWQRELDARRLKLDKAAPAPVQKPK
ncbi:MAG: hypothetical protein VW405_03385 [Rhodospirillaceae bacterium]